MTQKNPLNFIGETVPANALKVVRQGLAYAVAALVCGTFCFSCQVDRQQLISEKVAERVNDFKKKKNEEYRQRLLDKAGHIVDSLLLVEAQQSLQDSLARLRPFRPLQPPPVLPIDSNGIKPIFDTARKQ